ncbi:MAG: helix-turn-helix domain-containing protein [Oligoflexia bacterium]|nr:helix-turn-helix domain-containing protein [Oligoflexia bacterium]
MAKRKTINKKSPTPAVPRKRAGASARATEEKGSAGKARSAIQGWLQLGLIRSEKCELREARVAYTMAQQQAKRQGDSRGMMEALAGLLRLAGEAVDRAEMARLEAELDQLMMDHHREVPALAWYCKGAIARERNEVLQAQRYFHRYLRAVRQGGEKGAGFHLMSYEEAEARGWLMLAVTLSQRQRVGRATWLAQELLRRYEGKPLRGVQGMLELLIGNILERQNKLDESLRWYQKAHGSFLAEHNWYYHLYVLYGYARLARKQQNYAQAYWHLDLIDKAAAAPEFGLLKREIAAERDRLERDAVDLLIDSRQCVIRTREGGSVSLRKQYVLLHILEALSQAHERLGHDRERGLSKAEIIEYVWAEAYRPEAHDNKLYYNINRLRKLIEPDIKKPQYLLNWKEGYRLAPGLRIQFIGTRRSAGVAGGLESLGGGA